MILASQFVIRLNLLLNVCCEGFVVIIILFVQGKKVPVINSFSKNINMRLPNNLERYMLSGIYMCICIFVILLYSFRNLPMGITISSQISNIPMNRIEFSDNNFVAMCFKIEGLSVS